MTSAFIQKEPKIDLAEVRLTGQTRMKIEQLIEEQENGHLLRNAGLKPKYRALFHGAAGTGKAQPLHSKIAVPGGWKTLKEIEVGDIILTPDGKVAPITGVFPQGEKEIFEVVLIDGRTVECCEDHLWKVYNDDWRREKRKGKHIPRADVTKTGWRVITTTQLKTLLQRTKKPDFSIPTPIAEYPEADLPIDPYWLGAMLGNGSLFTPWLSFSTGCTETLQRIQNVTRPEYHFAHRSGPDWGIVKNKKGSNKNPYRQLLDKLGLTETDCYTKFLPEIYLVSSRQQRLRLLAGLLDTDGEVDKGGCIIYSTSSQKLRDGVQRLCWSLGYMCRIGEKTPTYTYKGKKLKGVKNYRLYIRANDPTEIDLIPKKKDRIPKNGQYKNRIRAKIQAVHKTGKTTEMVCVQVGHPERLYITDNYVVTHNTLAAEGIAFQLSRGFHIFNLESLSGTNPDEAMKSVMDALRLMNSCNDVFLFDEFDAIASHRSATSAGAAARQTSNALLIAFEQIKSNAILICATNFISTVDPAFRRRFDTICKFDLPSVDERVAILKMALGKYKMKAPEDDIDQAAKGSEGLSYHETEEIAIGAIKKAILNRKTSVNLIPEVPAALERRQTFRQTHDSLDD